MVGRTLQPGLALSSSPPQSAPTRHGGYRGSSNAGGARLGGVSASGSGEYDISDELYRPGVGAGSGADGSVPILSAGAAVLAASPFHAAMGPGAERLSAHLDAIPAAPGSRPGSATEGIGMAFTEASNLGAPVPPSELARDSAASSASSHLRPQARLAAAVVAATLAPSVAIDAEAVNSLATSSSSASAMAMSPEGASLGPAAHGPKNESSPPFLVGIHQFEHGAQQALYAAPAAARHMPALSPDAPAFMGAASAAGAAASSLPTAKSASESFSLEDSAESLMEIGLGRSKKRSKVHAHNTPPLGGLLAASPPQASSHFAGAGAPTNKPAVDSFLASFEASAAGGPVSASSAPAPSGHAPASSISPPGAGGGLLPDMPAVSWPAAEAHESLAVSHEMSASLSHSFSNIAIFEVGAARQARQAAAAPPRPQPQPRVATAVLDDMLLEPVGS